MSLIWRPASSTAPRSQRCWRPLAHDGQRPQDGTNDEDDVVALLQGR